MAGPNTIFWRKEHGLAQKAEAVIIYSPESVIRTKLQKLLSLYHLGYSEPLTNALLFAAENETLNLVINQWRNALTGEEYAEVRGTVFESPAPSAEELARAPMRLEELDNLQAQIDTRWLVRLLTADSVSVAFQPLVCMATGKCLAYECLVRGDRDGETVGAEILLSNARILGISNELDHAAWRAALRQGSDVMKTGVALFLNFTPSSIYTSQFNIQNTKALCREMGVDISQLVFEVTEAEKVPDLKSLRTLVEQYRAEGAKIALDDLGSGYSSILHLADLRPDWVKLDQRLVHGACADAARTVLLKAITEAAHKLNIRVVAEGIETEEDLKFCAEIGADMAQGYFLARPAESPLPVSADVFQVLEKLRHAEHENKPHPKSQKTRTGRVPALLAWLNEPVESSRNRNTKQR